VSDQFLRNLAYVEYVHQLLELHDLIARGELESEKADQLREEMDVNWYALSADEMERAGIISADLDMLVNDEVFRTVPPEQRTQEWFAPRFTDAWENQRWDDALALLRAGPPYLFEDRPDVAA